MAPMAYISNTKSPMGLIARDEGVLEEIIQYTSKISFNFYFQFFYNWFGDGELLPSNAVIDCLASLFCINPATVGLCSELVFIFAGFDSEQVCVESFLSYP